MLYDIIYYYYIVLYFIIYYINLYLTIIRGAQPADDLRPPASRRRGSRGQRAALEAHAALGVTINNDTIATIYYYYYYYYYYYHHYYNVLST